MSLPSLYKIVSYILFFLMLFSPFAFIEIKMVFISFLVISILLYLLIYKEKIKISKSILLWFSIFIFHGFFFSYFGLLNGAAVSNVAKFSTIAVLWPVVFLFFCFYKTDEKYLFKLYKVIEVALICISIYVIYKVLSIFGFLPTYDIYGDTEGRELMFNDGNIELSIPAATTLMFIVPSVITLYLLTKEKRLIPIILLAFIAVILTSRRALLLSVIVTPLICLCFSFFFLKKQAVKLLNKQILSMYLMVFVFFLIIFIVLAQLKVFDFKVFFSMILEGFDFSGNNSSDPGAMIRADQFTLLMKSWSEKPFLGWGYGSVSEYIIRSDETPFIYELSYIALLFQTGIVGFVIYMSLIFWIFYKFYKLRNSIDLIMNKYNISILVGLTTFLLANATNPYLYAFDHMWTLFYPLLILNTLVLENNKLKLRG